MISIVTVNLNNGTGLQRTIESVLSQQYSGWEYIVIDGGSKDSSLEVIGKFKDKLSYWISESDSGVYNAMNKGFSKAKGDYVLFLNAGDHLYDESALSKLSKHLGSADLIYGDLTVVEGKKMWKKQYPETLQFSYFVYDTLPHPATLIKRSLFDSVGSFNENNRIVSDWEFFLKCLFRFNCSYLHVDAMISTFYTDGMSSDPKNQKMVEYERAKVLKESFYNLSEDAMELLRLRETIKTLKANRVIRIMKSFGKLGYLE